MELNRLYKRNSDPVFFWEENHTYLNCGSFALDVLSWYTPYLEYAPDDDEDWYTEGERSRWIKDLLLEGHSRKEIMQDVLEKDFDFILETCPWLEPIEKEEISLNDRVIAYRLSMEIPEDIHTFDTGEHMDFHFCLFTEGEWWEKNGGCPIHPFRGDIEDPWIVDDWLVYDGDIKYARFKVEN